MANWDKITSRGDVEDRRSMAPAAVGGISVTGIALLLLVNYLSGGNLSDALNQIATTAVEQPATNNTSQFQGKDSYEVFVSEVLGSDNDMWRTRLAQEGKTYTEPKLVLFRQATQSGCGVATSQVGPHYCPIDQTIYLDETFFDELTTRFGAKGGDVAQAYVISHEAGHHAQNELGIMDKVQQEEQQEPDQANQLSVKLELQADCFAGLWANSLKDKQIIAPGEINEAIDAAAAVGDDRIQQKVEGYVNPETWTHGSSEERVSWFNKGYNTGDLEACDTFK
jgi:predicted metalloprotease